jgi:hypothetical protein
MSVATEMNIRILAGSKLFIELDVIRDIKFLKIMFHRMLLRITNGANSYVDYATREFPIRGIADPVPPVNARQVLQRAP